MAAVGNNKNLVRMPKANLDMAVQCLSTLELNCLRVTTKQFKEIAEGVRQKRMERYWRDYPDRLSAIQRADARYAQYSSNVRNSYVGLGTLGTSDYPAGLLRAYSEGYTVSFIIKGSGARFEINPYNPYGESFLVRDLKYALLESGENGLARNDGTLNTDRALCTVTGRVVRDDMEVCLAFNDPDIESGRIRISLDDAPLGNYLLKQELLINMPEGHKRGAQALSDFTQRYFQNKLRNAMNRMGENCTVRDADDSKEEFQRPPQQDPSRDGCVIA